MTLVPLKLYFNEKGRAKLELALARGKKLDDKRVRRKRNALGSVNGGVSCDRRVDDMHWPS